jgi:FkbM family methyltransferase
LADRRQTPRVPLALGMHRTLARAVKNVLDWTLERGLPRETRRKLGRHIYDRATGDNNSDPEKNGEYLLLDRAKRELQGGNAVFFDVGANIGEWTLRCARDAVGQWRIFAFEPSARTFRELSSAIHSSASATIEPINCALGETDGEAPLFVAHELAETSSMHRREGPHAFLPAEPSETIRVCRGDLFCDQHQVDGIDFVKIDTEGSEMAVLRGFQSHVAGRKVGVIQFEYGSPWIDARAFLADAFSLLTGAGYVMTKLHPSGLERLAGYHHQLERMQYANYAALRPDWVERLRGLL